VFKRILSLKVIFCFFLTTLGPLPKAYADTVLGLPQPGSMVNLSSAYEPVIIKGLTVHKDNPFLFDFIVDVGQDKMSGEPLKKEGEKLIKYFLASLAIPDKDVWVNLSPYEKNKMIPEALGQTDMGRDLLEQDYILKQITASLIYPEKELGKKFWDKVYAKAQQMYGTTQVPINTFNKVWIMADRAEVFEHNQTAFVVDQHLKVMLEEDYLALTKYQRQPGDMFNQEQQKNVSPSTLPSELGLNLKATAEAGQAPQGNHPNAEPATHSIASQIVKQIILPELEKEVNQGKNFANLRQIFNSIILSSWYKKNLKEALLNQVYADKAKVKGIERPGVIASEAKQSQQDLSPEQIYEQYLKAYKKGVFNYIKEDVNVAGAAIPRKYFSGGINKGAAAHPVVTHNFNIFDAAMGSEPDGRLVDFLTVASTQATRPDTSMPADARITFVNRIKRKMGVSLSDSGGASIAVVELINHKVGEADAIGQVRRIVNSLGLSLGTEVGTSVAVVGLINHGEGEADAIGQVQGIVTSLGRYDGNSGKASVAIVRKADAAMTSDEARIKNKNDDIVTWDRVLRVVNNLPDNKAYLRFGKDADIAFENYSKTGKIIDLDNQSAPEVSKGEIGITWSAPWGTKKKFMVVVTRENFIRMMADLLESRAAYMARLWISELDGLTDGQIEEAIKDTFSRLFGEELVDRIKSLQNKKCFIDYYSIPIKLAYMHSSHNRVGKYGRGNDLYAAGTRLEWDTRPDGRGIEPDKDTEWLVIQPGHMKAMLLGLREYSQGKTQRFITALLNTKVRDRAMDSTIEAKVEKLKPMLTMRENDGRWQTSIGNMGNSVLLKDGIAHLRKNILLGEIDRNNKGKGQPFLMLWALGRGDDDSMRYSVNIMQLIIFAAGEQFEWLKKRRKNSEGLEGLQQPSVLSEGIRIANIKQPDAVQKLQSELLQWLDAFEMVINQAQTSNEAMLTRPSNRAMTPGGIDLNPSSGMQWKVSKDGHGVEMNVDSAMIERVKREGVDWLSPVILKMTPVTSIWPLVGLQAP